MSTQITNIELIHKLRTELVFAAGRVNAYASQGDVMRNFVNYGVASQSARILCMLGQDTFIHHWEDDGLLKIEKLVINGNAVSF